MLQWTEYGKGMARVWQGYVHSWVTKSGCAVLFRLGAQLLGVNRLLDVSWHMVPILCLPIIGFSP